MACSPIMDCQHKLIKKYSKLDYFDDTEGLQMSTILRILIENVNSHDRVAQAGVIDFWLDPEMYWANKVIPSIRCMCDNCEWVRTEIGIEEFGL